jgi:hypothetical protein
MMSIRMKKDTSSVSMVRLFEKIKLKSKYLEKAMPKYDIKALSKKEKLNLSKEEDIKKLLILIEAMSTNCVDF